MEEIQDAVNSLGRSRADKVAEYPECSSHTVLRKMKTRAFGELKRDGGSDQRPGYEITYDGSLDNYGEQESPLKN